MRLQESILSEAHAVKCELAADVLRSQGKLRIQVTGWSMFPSIRPGDALFVDRINSSDISEGDIVLFQRDRRLFAHRVVANTSGGVFPIVTRGDAMPQPDSPLDETELLGRVSSILRDGKQIQPRKALPFPESTLATLVRRSDTIARFIVGIQGLRHRSRVQTA